MSGYIQDICVAVTGVPDSGKSRLAARIHKYVFRRPDDNRFFRFITTECRDLHSNSCEEFQFVLVAFDLTNVRVNDARDMAYEIMKTSSHPQLCLLGTKLDLIPQDHSDADLYTRGMATSCAYPHGLHYFSVSSVSGAGVTDVCHFIANQLYPCHTRPSLSLCLLLDYVGSWVLDAVASIFALPVPKNVNQQSPDTLHLDNATVNQLVKSPEALAWDRALHVYSTSIFSKSKFIRVPAHKITPTLLAKTRSPSEYENMVYVRTHTTIPVPQPRYPHLSWLVMDLIDGKMLLECWEAQSLFMKFRIACTMRGYISQLRQLTGSIPGTVVDGIIGGPLFEDEDRGPFDCSTIFRRWCEMIAYVAWISFVRRRRSNEPMHLPPPPVTGGEWPLVYTHGDLNLGNMMLSKDGVLWVIDWATSGFFPPWLESVGLKIHSDAPDSWKRFRWFMAGSYPEYENFWELFMQAVHRDRRGLQRTT